MNRKIRVSIAGASGYAGGELLRILLFHPNTEVVQISSERYRGKSVPKIHPNLRKVTKLKFSSLDELNTCDLLFLSLPHGESMKRIREFKKIAPKIIDLSGDFRLKNEDKYRQWYGTEHSAPELLKDFVYGIPELHREEMINTDFISSAGCNATATILPLYPLYKEGIIFENRTVTEVKVGSSEGGNMHSSSSHHPEKSGSIRTYKAFGHRHISEMEQELAFADNFSIHFSATSIDMVRGIHSVSHTFLKEKLNEKDIRKIYREYYGEEPFIRIVKERDGLYRLPDPKLLTGTNYCDIGFELDNGSNRLIVFGAIDNLMKGAAGQAVQAMNIMLGFDERTGLEFPGLHPI